MVVTDPETLELALFIEIIDSLERDFVRGTAVRSVKVPHVHGAARCEYERVLLMMTSVSLLGLQRLERLVEELTEILYDAWVQDNTRGNTNTYLRFV